MDAQAGGGTGTPARLLDGYRADGFAGRLEAATPMALVVIDMAQAYFERGSPLDLDDDALLGRVGRLVQAARDAAIPVLHTRLQYDAEGRNGGLFYKKVAALRVFQDGSPLAAFAPGMQPAAHELIVTKQYASAFFGTSLASTLQAMGIRSLLIAGVSTSGCVRASAVDAMQLGFAPFVVRDAVGDRHPSLQAANLLDLEAKYAEVISLPAALAMLAPPRTAAGTPSATHAGAARSCGA